MCEDIVEFGIEGSIKRDIEFLLRDGREKLYRETFYLLKSNGDDTK